VFGGVVSVKLGAVAAAGPLFVTCWVYVTLPPGETVVGAATLVTTRSACVPVATTSDAVAVLFAEFESVVVVVTVAVWLIAVPAAVPAVTLTVKVIVPDPPEARLGSVHVSVARVQVQPAGPVSETAVVFAGNVSTRLTLAASLGPELLTSCV
jgi:hypothetical protein